jgi:hypothetical protein
MESNVPLKLNTQIRSINRKVKISFQRASIYYLF